MTRDGQRSLARIGTACLLAVVTAAVLSGCGRSEQDFRPSVADARTALETALDAWQKGAANNEPIQSTVKSGVVVQLFDSDFVAGKKLASWTIESGESPKEGPCEFKVKLELVAGNGPVSVTYYVTGISQHYSVFRDTDYQQRAGQM